MKSSKRKSGSGRTRLSNQRPWTPYQGPYHIPVLLDDVKRLGDFQMSRFLFFTVDPTGTVEDWISMLRVQQIPFLLFGLTAVIHRPDLKSVTFAEPEHVDRLFNRIEENDGLLVESEHLWLPNVLFEDDRGRWKVTSGEDSVSAGRGDIWRISYDLFQEALRFRQEVVSRAQFVETCVTLARAPEPSVTFSRDETIVFREWSASQFAEARRNYRMQREDPGRGVLGWMDRSGEYHAG